MEVSATLIELEPGTLERVENWKAYIKKNLELAIDSIKSEGVEIESWLQLKLAGKEYLLCYMRAESLQESTKVFSLSENPVDEYHRDFLRSVANQRPIHARLLIDLVADKR